MRSYAAPIAIFCLTLLTAPLALLGGQGDGAGGPALVVMPPWRDAARIVENAGGWLVGPERAWLGVFAQSDHPDFAALARQNGAWAVLNSARLAGLCGAIGDQDV